MVRFFFFLLWFNNNPWNRKIEIEIQKLKKFKVSKTQSDSLCLMSFWILAVSLLHSQLNPLTSDVHKMIKHFLKILQQMLQDFGRMFDHFVDIRQYRVNFY